MGKATKNLHTIICYTSDYFLVLFNKTLFSMLFLQRRGGGVGSYRTLISNSLKRLENLPIIMERSVQPFTIS